MIASCIGRCYKHLLKPILFCFSPETMHTVFGTMGAFLGRYTITKMITNKMFHYHHTSLEQTYRGMHFPNPVGLAAGFDKDIVLPNIIAAVGFGREECGSITKDPYAGNTGTRLYRLPASQGLIVNYGLKNQGMHYAKRQIAATQCAVPLFVSIAKTNCTRTCSYEEAIQDYSASLEYLQDEEKIAGFVLNISCPNSFGGEDFTDPVRLQGLLQVVSLLCCTKPLLVKLPVDKSREDTKLLLQCCVDAGIQGVIISNLTKNREAIIEKDEIIDLPGGISGKATQQKADYLIGESYKAFGDRLLIVGVGGIFSAEDAYHKIKQGASLVQLITGMIYEGPQRIGQINAGVVRLLQRDGYTHISEAIGASHR